MTTTEKTQWITGIQQTANQMDAVITAAERLGDMYWAKGFNSGGADPITQEDIDGIGSVHITLAEVTAFYTVMEQLVSFYNNGSVGQADRKTPTLAIS